MYIDCHVPASLGPPVIIAPVIEAVNTLSSYSLVELLHGCSGDCPEQP